MLLPTIEQPVGSLFVVDTGEQRHRTAQRPIDLEGIRVVQLEIPSKRRQEQSHQTWLIHHGFGDAVESLHPADDFRVGGARGDRIGVRQVRRPLPRQKEVPRLDSVSTSQMARHLKRQQGTQAVPEHDERTVEQAGDDRPDDAHDIAEPSNGCFVEPVPVRGKLQRSEVDAARQSIEPRLTCGSGAAGVREPEQAQRDTLGRSKNREPCFARIAESRFHRRVLCRYRVPPWWNGGIDATSFGRGVAAASVGIVLRRKRSVGGQLLVLDGLEERFDVAAPEPTGALPLDDLEEER